MVFLVYYMFYRRHSGVRKELGVKTPFQAVEKPEFLNKILAFLKIKFYLCNRIKV